MSSFDISNRGLTTLVGVVFPEDVTELLCYNNLLSDLVGCPVSVKKLYCEYNLLTSLRGCPPLLEKLYCEYNLLTSLLVEDADGRMTGCSSSLVTLHCYNNQLTSLEGCPPTLRRLHCSNNRLSSLQGCSPSLIKLGCSNNQLLSLEGCPDGVQRVWCRNNQLLTLEHCPASVIMLYYDNNPLSSEYAGKSLRDIHALNQEKRVLAQKEQERQRQAVEIIEAAWFCYWLTPDKDGEAPCAKKSYERDIANAVSLKRVSDDREITSKECRESSPLVGSQS